MFNFFHEGGFGMYPTAVFGLAALVLAVVGAAKGAARLLPLTYGLAAAALTAGMLGTVMGLKATAGALASDPSIAPGQLALIAFAGASESSNNLVLALALTTVVALVLGFGGFRTRLTTA
jgi:hypothetical protein